MTQAFSILVVDDSLTQQAVLQDALEAEGYKVETAANGMEAIAKVYICPPSLILSDVLMPELNGYHLCRLLKNDSQRSLIPFVLLSNLSEQNDRFWGEHSGADRYLQKGADLAPILETVASLLPPSPPQVQASPTLQPPEIDHRRIRSRITDMLDRSLFESTICNETLKLTGLTHDIDLLGREFLSLLSTLARYSVAALLLRDGQDKHFLCLHVTEPVTRSFMALIKKSALRMAGLSPEEQGRVRVLITGEENCRKDGEESLPHPLQHLPIFDGDELLASIALFGRERNSLTEETQNALKVVAGRFLIVARYLKKIQEIEEVKADFISMLVHDMRSPLTGINGFTDVLAAGILGKMNDEQLDALGNVQSGCDRLLSLIEGILELSKLEAGKMKVNRSPLKIRPAAERAIADMAALFMEKSLDVSLHIHESVPYASADAKLLARVLANLLSNAVKFTPAGGRVALGAEESEGWIRVSISDSGPGIPEEQQEKLFGRYQQLPSSRMFRKGTGLGLAICREIVGLHGGRIWVESPVAGEGGSRFCFTLPVDEA